MNIQLSTTAVTMSSREIAELTDKQHKNVIRDIREMLTELEKDGSDLSHPLETKDSRGYTSEFHLDRELTETLLTGYSIPLRHKVVRRLRELEESQSPALPQTFAEALRLAADQHEQIEQQKVQLAIAAPKVEFVDKYVEATGLKGFREVCKLLKAKEHKLSEYLISERIMYRLGGKLTPYSNHIDAGRFEVKTGASDGGHAFNQSMFTPKGVNWVAGLWAQHNVSAAI